MLKPHSVMMLARETPANGARPYTAIESPGSHANRHGNNDRTHRFNNNEESRNTDHDHAVGANQQYRIQAIKGKELDLSSSVSNQLRRIPLQMEGVRLTEIGGQQTLG